MKTTLHYYLCDLTKMEGIREWKRIQRETRGLPMTLANHSYEYWSQFIGLDGKEIELPEQIFPNWFEGHTGFNASQIALHRRFNYGKSRNDIVAEGYYLEMTEEMQAARDNTYRCPCCSELKTTNEYFCMECVRERIENEKDIYKAFFRPVSVIDVLPKNILIPSEVKQIWRENHKQTQAI